MMFPGHVINQPMAVGHPKAGTARVLRARQTQGQTPREAKLP